MYDHDTTLMSETATIQQYFDENRKPIYFGSHMCGCSYLLVTIGGQLGWLKLFWQPFTLYLSYLYLFVHVLSKIK